LRTTSNLIRSKEEGSKLKVSALGKRSNERSMGVGIVDRLKAKRLEFNVKISLGPQ